MEFTEPLAYRMRPTHIDEVAGQQHVIGKDTLLYKSIRNGNVPSILLYGEPGIGKTSIASAIAGTVHRPFFTLNATMSGKKDVQEVIEYAEKIRDERKAAIEAIKNGEPLDDMKPVEDMPANVILFIDEVHRFNKAQQDVLLPSVEEGLIILIGATTANPYHDVNPAIRSRCGQVKQLQRLTPEDIVVVLKRALSDEKKGLARFHPEISDELLVMIAKSVNGEVRSALTVLELAVLGTDPDSSGIRKITPEAVAECVENKGFNHDKDGDQHYNVLSALQKSIRGSDTDAALHYAARLVKAGDLTSLLRRLIIICYEDISLADPQVATNMVAAAQACERVGFPEATGILSMMIVQMCNSPKSKTGWSALYDALADVESGFVGEIPMHLRDTHYASAVKLGHVGYLYPHDYPQENFGGWVKQQYLPDDLKDRKYYEPLKVGKEKYYGEIYERLKKQQK